MDLVLCPPAFDHPVACISGKFERRERGEYKVSGIEHQAHVRVGCPKEVCQFTHAFSPANDQSVSMLRSGEMRRMPCPKTKLLPALHEPDTSTWLGSLLYFGSRPFMLWKMPFLKFGLVARFAPLLG